MKIAMLVNNACVNDARVIREAEALAEAAHGVTVFALSKSGIPNLETKNGVHYRRFEKSFTASSVPSTITKAATPPARERCEHREYVGSSLVARAASSARRATVAVVRTFKRGVRKLARYKRALLSLTRQLLVYLATPTGTELLRYRYLYTEPVCRLGPDVVHAHDLYTLYAGHRCAKATGAALIYDSHELEIGRNGNFSARERLFRKLIERMLIHRTNAVVTVCDSIADYLVNLYGVSRPTVILNSPDENAGARHQRNIRDTLLLDHSVPLAIYVGSITTNRGLELCIQALTYYTELHLALIGPHNVAVLASLHARARGLGVEARFHVVPPVPHDEVTSFIRTADVSLILMQNVCLSYYFCFPNKLLESLLAGLPVVAARLVELERVVRETSAGVIVNETDPAAIAVGIRQVILNRAAFAPTPATVARVRLQYGWETQKQRLYELYRLLESRPATSTVPPSARV